MIVVSFLAPQSSHPAVEFIWELTEPVMAPLRQVLPPMGGLDFSPIILFIALNVIRVSLGHMAVAVGCRGSSSESSGDDANHLNNSVGIVSPQRAHFPEALYLESGEVLDGFELSTKPTASFALTEATPYWYAMRFQETTTRQAFTLRATPSQGGGTL